MTTIPTDMLLEAVEDLGLTQQPSFTQVAGGEWTFAVWRSTDTDIIGNLLGELVAWQRRHGMAGVGLPINADTLFLEIDHDVHGSDLILSLRVDRLPDARDVPKAESLPNAANDHLNTWRF